MLIKKDFARRLLAIHASLQTLERGLLLQTNDVLETDSLYSTEHLQRLASQYRELTYLITKIPSQHRFLKSQQRRIEKVKSTLQKDIQDSITQAKKDGNTNELFTLLQISNSIAS